MPDVSIVMPTFNRLEQLKQVIAALEKQSYPVADFEVVIVSDGSTDGTNEYLQSLQTDLNLVPVIGKNGGPSVARNRGIDTATGDIILFVDDDVVPAIDLITEHVETHKKLGPNMVVIGPMLTPPGFNMAPWVQWEQAMLMKDYKDLVSGELETTARQFYTGNASVPRCHLGKNNRFDVTFWRSEDVELAYRLADQGLQFVFNENAIGYHYAHRTFASWLKTPYAYGCNEVIVTRDKGQESLLPSLLREFHERHILVRALARLCISRHTLATIAVAFLRQCATLSSLMGWRFLTQRAYSGIFNLRYYQGMTDELGSRQTFFDMVDQAI